MAASRRLAAILAADVVGYSRLMGADEEGTHERLKAHLRQLIRKPWGRAMAVAPASFEMYARNRVPWMRPEDHAHMLEGLRKAGWKG
jgi:hypothetical protein